MSNPKSLCQAPSQQTGVFVTRGQDLWERPLSLAKLRGWLVILLNLPAEKNWQFFLHSLNKLSGVGPGLGLA